MQGIVQLYLCGIDEVDLLCLQVAQDGNLVFHVSFKRTENASIRRLQLLDLLLVTVVYFPLLLLQLTVCLPTVLLTCKNVHTFRQNFSF